VQLIIDDICRDLFGVKKCCPLGSSGFQDELMCYMAASRRRRDTPPRHRFSSAVRVFPHYTIYKAARKGSVTAALYATYSRPRRSPPFAARTIDGSILLIRRIRVDKSPPPDLGPWPNQAPMHRRRSCRSFQLLYLLFISSSKTWGYASMSLLTGEPLSADVPSPIPAMAPKIDAAVKCIRIILLPSGQ
jgi:hypothetical protein